MKQLQSFYNSKAIRVLLFLVLILGIIAVTTVFTLAWYTGLTESRTNRLTTGSYALKMQTTNRVIEIISPDGSPTQAPSLPQNTSEIFSEGNPLILLDDEANGQRKFFELNGENQIEGVSPNFRMRRPLIITNYSETAVSYTVDFIVKEIEKSGLSGACFINYTRLGDDISNEDLQAGANISLSAQSTVENLACAIKQIGSDGAISIAANSSHIYIIDVGILHTAGNAVKGAGLELDILLSTTQGGDVIRSIHDANGLKQALADNMGGETFLLTNDIIITETLTSNQVFNLDLNGYTLTFEENGMLEVFYPLSLATMDIGSDKGGTIIGSEAMLFHGQKGKSVLNWYSDITNRIAPSIYENTILYLYTVDENQAISRPSTSSSDMSSEPVSSEVTSSEEGSLPTSSTAEPYESYANYNAILSSAELSGDGSMRNPYIIETIADFKYLIEQARPQSYYKLVGRIEKVKEIPPKILTLQCILIFEEDGGFFNLQINGTPTVENAVSPFEAASHYSSNGKKLTVAQFLDHFGNIQYQ